jgi:aspartate/methionine/tyrosine aminotransferase
LTLAPNAHTRAIRQLRDSGVRLLDLTETNPTAAGITCLPDALVALADARGVRYTPDPRGLVDARDAIAREYARHCLDVSPDRLVLTSSTSEAYSVLFKLLCSPGDSVLVPQPSYPLFDLLTRLEGVHAHGYALEHHGVWSIDRGSLEHALTDATRAILVVSPNNPTGSMLRTGDRDWLLDLSATRGMALIVDEVFADFPLAPRADASRAIGTTRALTFSLGGLSKSCALPQVKLGWIVVDGPSAVVAGALERLEWICDAYLSVSTAVQLAAPRLLAAGRALRAAVAARIEGNLHRLRQRVDASPSLSLLDPEGGWSAVLRIPAIRSEEAIVIDLVERAHVIVHPGYFFDFASEAFVVMSLLPEPVVFDEALDRALPLLEGGR